MANVIDLTEGMVYVVTDLHGDWEAYSRYRDHFLNLYHHGQADYLVFLGDMVHSYGAPERDASIAIGLDIIAMQDDLESDRVIAVLGNHEFPHIYGVPLSKGSLEFTPRFEHALGSHREKLIGFFKQMPYWLRTSSGVLLTHAGAVASIASQESAEFLARFAHDDLLQEVDRLLEHRDVLALIGQHLNMTQAEYAAAARHYLAVAGPADPRYLDFLRGFVASNFQEWTILWDFLFNRCEAGLSASFYQEVVRRFLKAFSSPTVPQQVLLTGHIAVRGGYALVTDEHLRLASWAHATPNKAGCFVLFDAAHPVTGAAELEPHIHSIF